MQQLLFSPGVRAIFDTLQMNGTLKALALIGAPAVLLQLVCLIYKCNSIMCMSIDMCEYFAGCMAVFGTRVVEHIIFFCNLLQPYIVYPKTQTRCN